MTDPRTVRDATLEVLRAYGMTTIFGNPGSTELPMLGELPDDFRYVLGLQESVAAGMADGYSQATRNAAVVNLHSATGVGHAMGSLFTAYRNRSPLVVIAGQQARSMLGGEPYLYSEDAAALPRPYVKWSREPARAEDVPAAIARAYHVSMTTPRGPTLVSVPADDWGRAASEPVAVRAVSTAVRADPDQLRALGQALAGATRPAFVVGAAVDQDQAFDDVIRLAELHNARVWAQPMSSRCSFPELHPLFAGFLAPRRTLITQALAGHDLLLVIGAPVFTYHVATEGTHVPSGCELYQLTDDANQAAWTPIGTSIVGGIRASVHSLLQSPPRTERPRPPARGLPAAAEAGAPGAAGQITPQLLVRTLARLRPAGSVIVEEAPSTRPVMCDYLPNDEPDSFFTCASGGLGHGLPAAVGRLIGQPDRRVIAVVGDGSAMYAPQALWTAAQLGDIPLTVIVVNNGCYATVHSFARAFGLKSAVGSDLPGLDFAAIARGQGCTAATVRRPDELEEALRTALSSRSPYLLDVLVSD